MSILGLLANKPISHAETGETSSPFFDDAFRIWSRPAALKRSRLATQMTAQVSRRSNADR